MSAALRPVSDRDFDRTVEAAAVPVLIEFWKPGCGHCQALMVELQSVQDQAGAHVLVLTMNVEEHPQIAAELDITTLPALALYQNGEFTRFIGGLGKRDNILEQLGLGRAGT